MADQEVVIVGGDGTEHVFPPGFDPQKAAAIVRGDAGQGWASSLRSIASPEGLQGLKDYGKELISGDGTARSAVADYGKKEGGAFLSTLNPVNQVKGVLRAVTTNPITTAKGLYDTGKSALEGDPQAVGSVLGMAVAPKADAAVLRGVNTASTALAESPAAQRSAGYIGGAVTGVAGAGHPFIMGRVGQAVAPVIGSAARAVSNATGSVMDMLGMDRANGLPKEFDRYAPNASGYTPPSASDGLSQFIHQDSLPTMPQGVYTQLGDGSWGVKALPGHALTEGETVNVMNRNGLAQVKTVGKIGPDGVATIGDAPAPTPSEPMFVGGKRMDAALQAKILKHLRDQSE